MSQDGANEGATLLLARWRQGDEDARARLLELLHDEMRQIARRLMRAERKGHTLQPTAVVNEACLRLLGSGGGPAGSRAEFLGLAAHVMRRVLVDHARQRDADKRGGEWQRVSLQHVGSGEHAGAELVDALDLDAALERLAELSPRQARIAELRYFGGCSVEETAEALGVSARTVNSEWSFARLWLRDALSKGDAGPAPEA